VSAAHISINRDICSGHGRCYSLHPELFDVDDSGHPIIRTETISAEQASGAQDAAANCPEGAINVTALTDAQRPASAPS
jgi:ferredoxin